MTDLAKVLVFENTALLTAHLLKVWTQIAAESVEDHNKFNVALSGGRTPVEFYCRLSHLEDFDLWQKTHIFLADERFVPFESEENNFRMIKNNLLDYVPIPEANIHPVETSVENAAVAAGQFKDVLLDHFSYQRSRLPCFDLILLGMGEDGHTASLFEGVPYADNEQVIVVPVSLPHLKHERISLTFPVINNARHVLFHVTGRRKAEIVKRVLEEQFDCPAARVRPARGQLVYFIDKEAASGLSGPVTYFRDNEAVSL